MSKPTFRIIEGEINPHDDIYEDFKADYLSIDITVDEMLEKYNISKNTYKHLRLRVAEETGVNRKMTANKFTRMWTHQSRFIDHLKLRDKYRVAKVINGKYYHFGVYDDMDTAIYVRDKLEENNWSNETYKQLRWELFND